MIADLSPGLILVAGALLVPFLRGVVRSAWMLALPVVAFAHLAVLPAGEFGQIGLFGLTLTTVRVDALSRVFGYIFLVAALLGVIYSLHVRDTLQHVAGLVYAGSAVGATFAGDLLTLFVFWEGTAIASVFLIWASRTESAFRAGMRYLIIQIGSGVLLLAGAVILFRATGSLAFGPIGLDSPAGVLIFLAFGIKCAFPLLHNWLEDAYPEATVTGTVILSAFTTKLAVYALARGYAGTEILVPVGAAMAAFPIVYALVENDLRRVLAYSLNTQLGFMVVGVGVGTELALNGAVAHAVGHILYKALLFMAVGAVLWRAGTAKGSELGGLWRSMPWTAGFCVVGAASISAVPLFSGFVSKAMIFAALMQGGYFWTWLVLLFVSAAALAYVGIKVPFFAFFASGPAARGREAPANMLAAMALAAVLCVAIGILPGAFQALLPHAATYAPYTFSHVVTQFQMLAFSALAVALMMRAGLYPPAVRGITLDTDWFYRRAAAALAVALLAAGRRLRARAVGALVRHLQGLLGRLHRHHGPQGVLARSWPTGSMAFWTTVLLAAYLIAYYI